MLVSTIIRTRVSMMVAVYVSVFRLQHLPLVLHLTIAPCYYMNTWSIVLPECVDGMI